MIPTEPAAFFAFFMVFVRCSAALMASPVFGAANTPVQIRVMTTLAIAAALSLVIGDKVGPMPSTMGGLMLAALNEAASGVLIGFLISFVLQMVQVAGAFLDMQVGLSISQSLNPITGVSVTVLAQFKYMLSIVAFLAIDGHHLVIEAIVRSYETTQLLSLSNLDTIHLSLLKLFSNGMMLALQIATPVLGVSLVVDAALGAMNKAIPQLQPINVGMPAKIGLGLAAVSLTIPAVVAAVNAGVGASAAALGEMFRAR